MPTWDLTAPVLWPSGEGLKEAAEYLPVLASHRQEEGGCMSIMPALWMKKLRPREAPRGELGARPSSSSAPSLLPLPATCVELGGRPQGPGARAFLPESRGLLPACMPPNGGPVAGPGEHGQPSRAAQRCREGRPGPPRRPPGAPCIFNAVYYSCFVSRREPEQLTEEPRTAWDAGQWACSALQLDLKTPQESPLHLLPARCLVAHKTCSHSLPRGTPPPGSLPLWLRRPS